ncbi:hypothetical protein ACCO45_002201 [Purpureocillium lilacinum]|uniref:Uncharacterized protein n=1 Tax=Purpureocillium lilacinum TaxID=33203 RepID=A0ACC4E9D3_PURLI
MDGPRSLLPLPPRGYVRCEIGDQATEQPSGEPFAFQIRNPGPALPHPARPGLPGCRGPPTTRASIPLPAAPDDIDPRIPSRHCKQDAVRAASADVFAGFPSTVVPDSEVLRVVSSHNEAIRLSRPLRCHDCPSFPPRPAATDMAASRHRRRLKPRATRSSIAFDSSSFTANSKAPVRHPPLGPRSSYFPSISVANADFSTSAWPEGPNHVIGWTVAHCKPRRLVASQADPPKSFVLAFTSRTSPAAFPSPPPPFRLLRCPGSRFLPAGPITTHLSPAPPK